MRWLLRQEYHRSCSLTDLGRGDIDRAWKVHNTVCISNDFSLLPSLEFIAGVLLLRRGLGWWTKVHWIICRCWHSNFVSCLQPEHGSKRKQDCHWDEWLKYGVPRESAKDFYENWRKRLARSSWPWINHANKKQLNNKMNAAVSMLPQLE